MKIVFLDTAIMNPGDIPWTDIKKLGTFSHYTSTTPADFQAHAGDADAVLVVRSELNKAVIESAHHLSYIGVVATGYDKIDIEAADKAGITVTNVPSNGITAPAVAQGAMALLLHLTNYVGHYTQKSTIDAWRRSGCFCYVDRPVIDLAGLTIGMVGFGDIGHAFGKRAHANDMKIIATTHSGKLKANLGYDVQWRPLEALLEESDVVSLHCPLRAETAQIINKETLARMKPGAILINTARGGLVDELALRDALCSGKLRAAGLDVLSIEPPPPDNPLLSAPNCVITPHNSWTSKGVRTKFLAAAIENLANYLEGRPQNVVNAPVAVDCRQPLTRPRNNNMLEGCEI